MESEADIKNGQSTINKSANTLPAVETDSGNGSAHVNMRTGRVDEEKYGKNKNSSHSADITM